MSRSYTFRKQKFENNMFRMNSFMKELCDEKIYTKTAKKLELEVEKATLEDFVRYLREKRSKPKFSGLSFEVRVSPLWLFKLKFS